MIPSEPPLPGAASLRAGQLHYLTTINDVGIWWDDGSDIAYAYLVGMGPNGIWTTPPGLLGDRLPPAVAEFIRNHASL